jgi:hypothetical protein
MDILPHVNLGSSRKDSLKSNTDGRALTRALNTPLPSLGLHVPFMFPPLPIHAMLPAMPDRLVIAFTPVPLRARADGWSPRLQVRFIDALARGLTPAAAARELGKNRQTAYALRKRPGAESFAAAWDAAIAFALETKKRAGLKSDSVRRRGGTRAGLREPNLPNLPRTHCRFPPGPARARPC